MQRVFTPQTQQAQEDGTAGYAVQYPQINPNDTLLDVLFGSANPAAMQALQSQVTGGVSSPGNAQGMQAPQAALVPAQQVSPSVPQNASPVQQSPVPQQQPNSGTTPAVIQPSEGGENGSGFGINDIMMLLAGGATALGARHLYNRYMQPNAAQAEPGTNVAQQNQVSPRAQDADAKSAQIQQRKPMQIAGPQKPLGLPAPPPQIEGPNSPSPAPNRPMAIAPTQQPSPAQDQLDAIRAQLDEIMRGPTQGADNMQQVQGNPFQGNVPQNVQDAINPPRPPIAAPPPTGNPLMEYDKLPPELKAVIDGVIRKVY